MSSVSSVTGSGISSALSAITGGSTMGKEDFLTLLVTQLQNQDPLNPSDPTEFTAQLAQFSSLEQLFTVNETLQSLTSATEGQQQMSALSLIGREAVFDSECFRLGEENVSLGYNLATTADRVELHIQDQNGKSLAILKPEDKTAGTHFVTWDGLDQNGRKVSSGEYTLSILALDTAQEGIQAKPLFKGRITGVDLDPSGSVLVTGSGDFAIGDLVSVRDGEI
jgi:flagellar basal-body rod modification protein FlgD